MVGCRHLWNFFERTLVDSRTLVPGPNRRLLSVQEWIKLGANDQFSKMVYLQAKLDRRMAALDAAAAAAGPGAAGAGPATAVPMLLSTDSMDGMGMSAADISGSSNGAGSSGEPDMVSATVRGGRSSRPVPGPLQLPGSSSGGAGGGAFGGAKLGGSGLEGRPGGMPPQGSQ